MIIEKTNYGKLVKVWNDGYPEEWNYQIRNVKVLNGWFDEQHPQMDVLAAREAKIERKLILLLFSMENVFRQVYDSDNYDVIDTWEAHNRMNFNEWYHDQIRELIDEIDGISSEYCDLALRDGYGWCY